MQQPVATPEQSYAALIESLQAAKDVDEQIRIVLQAAEAMPDDVNMLVNCAQLLFMFDSTGEYAARCEQMLRRAVRLANGGDTLVMAQQALAEFLMMIGKSQEAVQMLEEALEKAPGNSMLEYTLAMVFFETGREAEAETLIEAVLEDAPQFLEARTLRADMWRADCQWDTAMEAYKQIAEEWPEYIDGLYGQYMTAVSSGQFDLAVRLLDTMISYGGGDALYLERARVRFRNQLLPEQALAEADALLRMDSTWVDAAAVKLSALVMLSRFDEAHAAAEDVAVVDALTADVFHGAVLMDEGKWAEAREVLADVTTREDAGPMVWQYLSVALLEGYDDVAGAEEALAAAFDMTGGAGFFDAFTQLGFLRFRQGDLLEAARAFAAADRSVYDDAAGLYYLCMVSVAAGHETLLRETTEEMERRYPGWYQTMLARVLMESALGNTQAALDAYALLAAKFPVLEEMDRQLKASLYAEAGDEAGKAIMEEELADLADTATAQDWDAYAMVLVLLGDTEGAEAALAEAEARLESTYAGVLRNEQVALLTTQAEMALEAGDLDASAALFAQAVEAGWVSLPSLQLNPRYAALVASDAYAALLTDVPQLPSKPDLTVAPALPAPASP